MEDTGREIICGAPTTLAVEGWTMVMMGKKKKANPNAPVTLIGRKRFLSTVLLKRIQRPMVTSITTLFLSWARSVLCFGYFPKMWLGHTLTEK